MNPIVRIAAVLLSLTLGGCFGQPSAPSSAPANVTVTAGESLAVLNWDTVSGLTYWIYYKKGASVSRDNYDDVRLSAKPPYLLTGLENGSEYAFSITSLDAGSQVGPFSPAVTTTPRLLGPGIPWSVGTSLTVNDLQGIAFGNNAYVAVGNAAALFTAPYSYTDEGGVTAWSEPGSLPIGPATHLTSVLHDGARFVVLGDDGSAITSTNTTTWNAATAISGAPAMNAIAVGGGRYVAVGDAGAIYSNSGDGVTASWTARASGTANDLYGVSYVNGMFVAVGALGTLLTSSDGITWTTRESNSGNALYQVAFGADTYVAVGDAGSVVSSGDAATWELQTMPTLESLRAVVFGPDGQFIAVGTNGTLAYSSSGADGSWATSNAGSIDLNAIAANAVFIAVGAAGANVSGK